MKNRKILLVLLAILTAISSLFAIACDISKDPDFSKPGTSDSSSEEDSGVSGEYISSDWEVMPENTNPNLKYFGYFHGDGFLSQGSYIEEIAALQNSNVFLLNSAFSTTIAREKLAVAKEYGFKVIFSTHGFFTGGQITKANSATLVENYKQVWSDLCAAVDEYVQDGTILAFYFDEPAWNGVKEEDFRTVTKMIRETYPNVKVLTTMTVFDIGVSKRDGYPEISPSYNEFCTDVSYDSYAKWNDKTRRIYLEALKSKATNNQYIWGCATGFTDTPEANGELYRAIKGMYTEAIQEPRYAGILPFSYANGFEGDWGYGLHDFFSNTSDFYDRELRKLYVQIGREVCGLEPYDFSQDIDVVLYQPQEVYEIGETIKLPIMGAADGNGNGIPYTVTITSPSGESIEPGKFTATESGAYLLTVTAGEGDRMVSKSVNLSVRYPGEISLFDDPAYVSDAGGTDADTWCWPRQVDTTFSRTGGGSLRVTPHATDGTWPRIVFNRNGYQLWDISNCEGISMWVYNPSETPIQGFALMVSNEEFSNDVAVHSVVEIPSKVWTEVTLDINTIKESSPTLDLTQVTIFYGNAAAGYENRTNFYIDDVVLVGQTETEDDGIIDFEAISDKGLIGGSEADLWCWPTEVSANQAHSGNKSLRIKPHVTDGTWPNVIFKNKAGETHDLTNAQSISMWVYFDSDNGIETLGIKLSNENDSNQFSKSFSIPSRTWTEILLTAEEFASAVTDLTDAYVKFSQLGETYSDRSDIYVDDFTIVYGEGGGNEGGGEGGDEEVLPVPEGAIGFESNDDLAIIGDDADDIWTWPVSISTAQKHTGLSSLKITVRQDGAIWPNVVIKNGASATYDLTNAERISIWVYFDSDNGIDTLGIKLSNEGDTNKFENTFSIPSRTWTEIVLTAEEFASAVTDLSAAYIKFSQMGGTYTDRSNFYLDDFTVVYGEGGNEGGEGGEGEDEVILPVPEGAIGFESEDDLALIGDNADDIWTWPVSISAEQKHTGLSSLKVTVRQDGAIWPNVVIKNGASATYDLTNAERISIWVYFDSDNGIDTLGIKLSNEGDTNKFENTFSIPSRTWTEIVLTAEEFASAVTDLSAAYIKFSQMGGTYTDRSNFYLDDFTVVYGEAGGNEGGEGGEGEDEEVLPVPEGAIGFESVDDLALIGDNADDIWTWPVSISAEQKHTGSSSLKITVRQDGATWPNVVIGNTDSATVDFTNVDHVSLWIYFDSENAMNNFIFKINNGENVNQMKKGLTLPARVWTEVTISKLEILSGAPAIDLTAVRVCIAQDGGTYTDKSNFYVDDFMVVEAEEEEEVLPVPEGAIGFESMDDFALIGGTSSDVWCWKPSISNEQAHTGSQSLKITPHATDGTWPNVVFKNGASENFDLSAVASVSIWIYFDSDKDISGLGLQLISSNGEKIQKTFNVQARTWVKLEVTAEELIAKGLDLSEVSIMVSQMGGTYTDRSCFYLDDLLIK